MYSNSLCSPSPTSSLPENKMRGESEDADMGVCEEGEVGGRK